MPAQQLANSRTGIPSPGLVEFHRLSSENASINIVPKALGFSFPNHKVFVLSDAGHRPLWKLIHVSEAIAELLDHDKLPVHECPVQALREMPQHAVGVHPRQQGAEEKT